MKKFILSFVLTVGMSAISFANDIQLDENAERTYTCTIETDTDDGGCCTQTASSTVSMTDACKKALKEKCATISDSE